MAGPAFLLAWGEWAALAFCPPLPSSSSLSRVAVAGAAYLWATEKGQAKPGLWDALPGTGQLQSPGAQAEDRCQFPRTVGIQGQCTAELFITRV